MKYSSLTISGVAAFLVLAAGLSAGDEPHLPVLQRSTTTEYHLEGLAGKYITRISENWLKLVPEANPAILEMFRDRERKPYRLMEPWAGEFAGKYLTGAVQVYRLTHDKELRAILVRFVDELISLQADDGYLGPWPQGSRLTGHAPNMTAKGGPTWDAWGHYHVMLGLLLWHEETGDANALKCASRIGDLMCHKFLGDKKPRLVDTGSTEMNLAPVDALCMLYELTTTQAYLDLAKQIAQEFAAKDAGGKPLAGDYLNSALAGNEFFTSPKPRWESLHPILGLVRLYYLTGDVKYRQAFEHWWWSIVKLDRHNNGGFSSGEQAQGNPYHQGAIETCCTIAWLAMGVEMLKLTGNSIVADELELSTLNSVLGMHSPSGRWCTYNTPMDGVRKASAHEIVFQAREGSPELNCCSVNGARGFGLISDWALLQDKDGLVLNWYGPGTMTTTLPFGTTVKLHQQTEYPKQGTIRLLVTPSEEVPFTLKLRIPHWSAKTMVKVNGKEVPEVKAGSYLALKRTWKQGDVVEIELDMSLHFWAGEKECKDKVSIYRGPILLTYDRRFNAVDPEQLPVLHALGMVGKVVEFKGQVKPELLVEFITPSGPPLYLCDFGSRGMVVRRIYRG
ncbi:MAG: glycoside hydrolase family 127 protein [Gemmatales bacterium]